MKKLIFGLSLLISLSFLSNNSFAQTFTIALQEYRNETGTTTYEGQELQPQWFEHEVIVVARYPDGKPFITVEWNQFRIFGKVIWTGKKETIFH